MGEDFTLLFDDREKTTLGGYEDVNFYRWEAERVVAVTTGCRFIIVELAMRAKTELILSRRRKEIS